MPESITLRLTDSKPLVAVPRISMTCLDPATAVVITFVSLDTITSVRRLKTSTRLRQYY
jgi:hypothetical protein